jgi:hypothetical protein
LDKGLGGPQSWFGCCGKTKISFPAIQPIAIPTDYYNNHIITGLQLLKLKSIFAAKRLPLTGHLDSLLYNGRVVAVSRLSISMAQVKGSC